MWNEKISHNLCTCLIPTSHVKVKKCGKLEFWENKLLDNKPLIRHFDV